MAPMGAPRLGRECHAADLGRIQSRHRSGRHNHARLEPRRQAHCVHPISGRAWASMFRSVIAGVNVASHEMRTLVPAELPRQPQSGRRVRTCHLPQHRRWPRQGRDGGSRRDGEVRHGGREPHLRIRLALWRLHDHLAHQSLRRMESGRRRRAGQRCLSSMDRMDGETSQVTGRTVTARRVPADHRIIASTTPLQ